LGPGTAGRLGERPPRPGLGEAEVGALGDRRPGPAGADGGLGIGPPGSGNFCGDGRDRPRQQPRVCPGAAARL